MKTRPATSNQSTEWAQFEADVRTALEAAGFNVEADVLLAGCQVDLYAERKRDLFTDRLVVECKAEAKTIGVEQIRGFSGMVQTISSNEKTVCGLFVANSGFTRFARAFARDAGIQARTLSELITISFDAGRVISNTIAWFKESGLDTGYVPLSCQVDEFGAGTIYKPVERFLDEFFSSTMKHGVAVLGNFGTGKTSLCRHYAYLLAQRWNDPKERSFLPIYVDLRDIRSLLDLEESLLRTLEDSYETRATRSGLEMWLRQQPTLLILDGFDEMAAGMDRVSINQNIRSLSLFSERYRCKTLLTCRTHFFRTEIDEKPLAYFMRLYMRDWGSEELIEFVGRRMSNVSAASILKTIKQTYNLEELAKTPIFLRMMTETLADIDDSASHAKLYQVFTDRWIEAQDYRSQVSPYDKREFMESLAYELFVSGDSHINYADLPKRVLRMIQQPSLIDGAKIEEDFRTCSFLVRDPAGQYRFVNRSYMEFFVASRLAQKIKKADVGELKSRYLPPEVAGFMAHYFESDWEVLLPLMIRNEHAMVRANCASILGELPRGPRLQEAFLVALDEEKEEVVQRSLVRALLISNDDRGVDKIVSRSLQGDSFSAFCVEELGAYLDRTNVQEIYSSVLDGEHSGSVVGALRSIERYSAQMLRDPIGRLVLKEWWRYDINIVTTMHRTIDAIADTELSVIFAPLLAVDHEDQDIGKLARALRDSLSQRVRRDVESYCRELHRSNHTYPQNRGKVQGKFGVLIDDEHLTLTLNQLYTESEAVKDEQVEGGVSGGSRSGRTLAERKR